MNIPKIATGCIITMKKPHPCGCNTMTVLRTGSDIRLRCNGCDHDITVSRIKLEKSIKKIEFTEEKTHKSTRGNGI